MGLEQAIVSASHQQALDSQVEEQGLGGFFQARLGISDIYAGSKAGLAQRYLESQGVPPEQALFVGDTLHDWEVAQEAGCPCVLLAQGHQSRALLETAGVPVLESLIQVPAFCEACKLNPPPETEGRAAPKAARPVSANGLPHVAAALFYACLKCFDNIN